MSVRLPWRNTEPSDRPPGPSQECPDPRTSHAPPRLPHGPPKPLHGRSPLAARTYTLSHRSQRVETQPRPPCGRSPVRQADPQRLYPSRTFRERSQTHAWAKPCLAGRPTALVRTQSPEQNTSRGRPSGMELPDYPVVVLTPTPWDQDGPTRNLPAGSFFKFVTRYASRRVFPQIRSSLRFPPPGLAVKRSSWSLRRHAPR
jgi:hypothetical protein